MQENGITLSAEEQDAFRLDAELKTHAKAAAMEMIETGRCLHEIKERNLFEYLGAKNLGEYAQKSVGFSERQAYNFIKIYDTYGENGLKKFGSLGMSKLVALAQLNDEDRQEMLDSGKAEELSTRELEKQIKELKHENDQLRLQFGEVTEETAKQDKQLEDQDKEIDELKKKLSEAQRPVVAAMTDKEKEEMRKSVEKELKSKHKSELDKLNAKHSTELKAEKDNAEAFREKSERSEEQIRVLTDTLQSLQRDYDSLQASAKSAAPAPAPSGNKELIAYCLGRIQTDWQTVLDTAGKLGEEDHTKIAPKLVIIAEKLLHSAEEFA